jgi:TetR/AcrR family transcriptional repressor of nem operon
MKRKSAAREKLLDVTFEEIYINGYAATSIDTILKKAGVPKGSLYHHFGSKKALVLAMIKERLFTKMDQFFMFEKKEQESVTESLRKTFAAVSKNRLLITYGCPLYRLMVELSPVDREFDRLLLSKYTQMQEGIASMLRSGIESGEFSDELDTETFSRFILSSSWGILSLSPSISSAKGFLQQSRYIFDLLDSYRL